MMSYNEISEDLSEFDPRCRELIRLYTTRNLDKLYLALSESVLLDFRRRQIEMNMSVLLKTADDSTPSSVDRIRSLSNGGNPLAHMQESVESMNKNQIGQAGRSITEANNTSAMSVSSNFQTIADGIQNGNIGLTHHDTAGSQYIKIVSKALASANDMFFDFLFDEPVMLLAAADGVSTRLDSIVINGVRIDATYPPGAGPQDAPEGFVAHCPPGQIQDYAHSVCVVTFPSEEWEIGEFDESGTAVSLKAPPNIKIDLRKADRVKVKKPKE